MIYKDTDIHFSINSQIKRSIAANIQFSTQDIDTAKLTFSLTKDGIPLPISQATHGKLFMRFADGSKFYVNTEVQDALGGVIFYVLTPEQVKHYGTVQAELYVNYDNGQKMSVHKFSFVIDRALVDQGIAPIAEYYIEDFETLKAVIQEMASDAEQLLAKFETLDNIETKDGAQEKANAAQEKAEDYTDQHAAKTDNPHKVTKSQVGLDKVDNVKQAAKTDFDAHTADNVRHITADERTKWNKGQLYKLTQDNGVRILIPDGTDLLTLPPGFYYGINNRLLNNPDPNDVGWFNYDIMDGNSGRKTIIATASYHNKMWFATIHTNGDFRGWKRILTSTDFEPVWTEVPLKNGAKHGARKVMCAVVGGFLCLKGEIITNRGVIFGTLPASYRPDQLRSRLVPIFGATGMTKLYIETNGNMRLEGQIADKSENITSYGLDEIIPL
ncbi:phage baseplate upper protein [Bacillus subtilis]|uniref:phage baseplate upper protein n=1 Tax=Bacillus subtilis TaxID=1423 RepID=UPI002DC02CFD|nr:phage baseplate upper protein [Bacillus subtilis]MEC2264958.1 phage baseplate upper protein [Bacillus subtilis]